MIITLLIALNVFELIYTYVSLFLKSVDYLLKSGTLVHFSSFPQIFGKARFCNDYAHNTLKNIKLSIC